MTQLEIEELYYSKDTQQIFTFFKKKYHGLIDNYNFTYEDLCSELNTAFVTALNNHSEYEGNANFYSYLFGGCRNRMSNCLKKKNAVKRGYGAVPHSLNSLVIENSNRITNSDEYVDTIPHEDTYDIEILELLKYIRVKCNLTTNEYNVLYSSLVENLTPKEISEKYDLTFNWISRLKKRTRAKCKEYEKELRECIN